MYWFYSDMKRAQGTFNVALEKQEGKHKIALTDALTLLRHYHFYQHLSVWRPLVDTLIVEDDDRRYIVDKDILVRATLKLSRKHIL